MTTPVSKQTRNNWLIDTALFFSAILASLSGIYFLFFPTGGFRGGRNPFYGITILFDRHTWEDLHTWTGVAMIAVALIHLIIHWKWVLGMTRRVYHQLLGHGAMNSGTRFNVLIDGLIAVSFFICTVSGLYFLFFPEGAGTVSLVFDSVVWDMLHTWSGVVMIVAAVIHFGIHWNWVMKVSYRIFNSLGSIRISKQPQVRDLV